jgi:hypothetical protein
MMNLGFIFLLCISVSGLNPGVQEQTPGQAPQSESASQSESKPPEHAPAEPAPTEQVKPGEQPAQQTPIQPEMQPETKPPDHAPQPTTTSPSSQEPESKPADVSPSSVQPKAAGQPSATTKKSRARKAHKHLSKPRKVIVRDGSTAEAISQLAPDMSTAEASHAKENTSQLLSTTEANLRRASSGQLNQNQLATVEQIRMFMEQSNAAMKAGDLQRGHNLALKALLLSNDLVKQ